MEKADPSEIQRLDETLQLYAAIVESVPMGIIIWQLEDPACFRLVSANAAASDLLRIKLKELVGRPIQEILPGVEESLLDHFRKVVTTGQAQDLGELYYGEPWVKETWCSSRAVPLPNQCLAIFFANISEKKQTEQAVRPPKEDLEKRVQERTRELEEANRDLLEKSQENEMFVYSVSHDLRSPLVNLQGFSKELTLSCQELREILVQADISDKVKQQALALVDRDMKEAVHYILTAVSRLGNIIDALLRLSRAGRVEYQFQQVNVEAKVERVVEALRTTIFERSAHVRIEPLEPIQGDPTALEQVFANLIGNALNYLDPHRPGKIEVSCYRIHTPEGETWLTYKVEDNGLGIPEPYQHKVFKAFQRLHPEIAKGEGMGLAIVRRIVERHRGKVWVHSRAGEGSTFYVSLPMEPGGR